MVFNQEFLLLSEGFYFVLFFLSIQVREKLHN